MEGIELCVGLALFVFVLALFITSILIFLYDIYRIYCFLKDDWTRWQKNRQEQKRKKKGWEKENHTYHG